MKKTYSFTTEKSKNYDKKILMHNISMTLADIDAGELYDEELLIKLLRETYELFNKEV